MREMCVEEGGCCSLGLLLVGNGGPWIVTGIGILKRTGCATLGSSGPSNGSLGPDHGSGFGCGCGWDSCSGICFAVMGRDGCA